MNAFEKLNKKVRGTIKSFGFKKPSPIQKKAIEKVLNGENSLLIAPTGTGKTEAALLPVFSNYLKTGREKGIKIIYIAPLRALNRDMLNRLKRWQSILEISIQVRHGDTSKYQRRKQALEPPDMLITTPETLQAILPGSRMKEHLKSVKWVIVDEVHELAESKRGTQLSIGLERLVRLSGDFQRIGLSATVGDSEEVGKFLAGTHRNIEIIDTYSTKDLSINVESPMPDKKDAELSDELNAPPTLIARLRRIKELINEHKSALTFVNTREASETLGSRLKLWAPDLPVDVHHGSLSKESRIAAEDDFRESNLKSLICTSSMELGVDIGNVDLTIQYSSPRQVSRLVQRVGRSGHEIGATSKGTILATDPEDVIEAGVISRHTLRNELEPTEIYRNSLDILAHQIIGTALDGVKDPQETLELVKRAYPYRKLLREEFSEVLKQLLRQRLIWRDKNKFSRGKKSWKYYYTNLSMIPDTKQYHIQNLVSGESIGTLDEEFVVGNAEPGITFICKGEAWRVLELEEDKVKVEPINDPYGAIPAWEGELIPVPFKIANEVAKSRKKIEKFLIEEMDDNAIVKELRKKYPIDQNASEWFIRYVRNQFNEASVPNDERLVIEKYENFVVLHSSLGTKVNKTFGQILSALISTRLGTSVGVKSDPYRIAFRLPNKKDNEVVEKTLNELESKYIDPLIEKILEKSSVFRWRLLHVAKRFGAVEKDADFSELNWRNIAESFRGTPIWTETEKEVKKEKLDISRLKEFIELIKEGKVKIEAIVRPKEKGPSPMGLSILNELASSGELVVPKRAEREILNVLKKRLRNNQIKVFCLNCRDWSVLTRVRRISEEPVCKNCGASYLTLVPKRKNQLINSLKKRNKKIKTQNKEENNIKRAIDAGNLILTYGKKAIIAMSARGIGPATAKRILAKQYKEEEDFYREILKAERTYARTHRFWD